MWILSATAVAAPAVAPQPRQLPPPALAALQRAGVPAEALSMIVLDTAGGRPLAQWQAQTPVNPASLTKLLTTLSALDRLGPAWTWSTPVWLAGPVRDGVLEGSVHIKGSGDPQFVLERVWLMLRRIQQQGVREIRGDIVLDGSAFAPADESPGDFDNEPLRPYNVRPAALLLNFRSVSFTFVPDVAAGVARVLVEPPLADTQVDRSVPLTPGACGDWRGALKAGFEPGRTRFAGGYASACGENTWFVADPEPSTYDARLIDALWRSMGGQLAGRVREGPAPTTLPPSFEMRSPPLADVVRSINKFSNNVMAQQLFLTLALQSAPASAPASSLASVSVPISGSVLSSSAFSSTAPSHSPATPEAAREAMLRWLVDRSAASGSDVVLDNGSGLSRLTRISAARLARVLQQAFDSPVMSELMSSLPIAGVDGTLRRSRSAPGRAHLKTGSLRDVAGVAGYVLTQSGRRLIVVAIINHPQANAARPALDAILQWAQRDAPPY